MQLYVHPVVIADYVRYHPTGGLSGLDKGLYLRLQRLKQRTIL